MSKFQVTKKEFLKNASAYRNFNDQQPSVNTQTGDHEQIQEINIDLRNENDPKWRKEVLEKLHTEKDDSFKNIDINKKSSSETRQSNSYRKRRRIDMLAEPMRRISSNNLPDPFRVRPSALNHIPSHRIQDLAMPRRLHARPPTKQSDNESINASKDENSTENCKKQPYEISERLKSLAQPRRDFGYEAVMRLVSNCTNRPMATIMNPNQSNSEVRMQRMARLAELTKIPKHKLVKVQEKLPGAVAYSALVCRASARVEELAGPKIRRTPRDNEYAFKTRPAALRYNPSARIENLAIAKIRRNDSNL
ncbi:uncharacterized protein [Atheta coriaria]|uniref:uncharacterized protein n=1 Tax=Dalotia coriaria TaxID=877792 RepID=UPI0031F40D80